MKKSPTLAKALDEKQCVVELVQWQDAHASPMFAYLLLKKNKLAAFRNALTQSDVDLAQFGVIVAYGSGSKPPQGMEQMALDAIGKVA